MKSLIHIVKRAVQRIISPLKRARRRLHDSARPPSPEVLNQAVHIEALARSREEWRRKWEWEARLHENGLLDTSDTSDTSWTSVRLGASSSAPDNIQAVDNGTVDSRPWRPPTPFSVSRNSGDDDREYFRLESSASSDIQLREGDDSDEMPPPQILRRVSSGTWFSGVV